MAPREMDEALADVRRAYRLVWAHQRRVMDMVRAAAEAFPETSHYYWSCNQFHRLPSRHTTDPTDCWAWNGLPLYDVSFLRLVEDDKQDTRDAKPGRWMLEIHHTADDGWDDKAQGEPDARNFGDAAKAKSSLSLILWQSHAEAGNWLNAWTNTEHWPEDDGAILESKSLFGICQSIDLAEVKSIEDVRNVASALRKLGKEKLGLELADLK